MKEILSYIKTKNIDFEKARIFEYLSDTTLDPFKRLAFAPYMAHFVFSFMDINRFVLRDMNAADELQELVNIHTVEDANHWPWYLSDIKRLGLDKTARFTEFFPFVWGDHCIQSRLLSYQMIMMIGQATTKEKIMLVEAIEMTGNVFLKATASLCREITEGESYEYYGNNHYLVETGHHIGMEKIEEKLCQIVLSPEEQENGKILVDKIYFLSKYFVDEVYAFVSGIQSKDQDRYLNSSISS